MPNSAPDMAALLGSLKDLMDQNRMLMDQLAQTSQNGNSQGSQNRGVTALISDIERRIPIFSFDPETEFTFADWYSRYEQILTEDGSSLDEKTRRRVLTEKLDGDCYRRLVNHILPKKPVDLTYNETVDILKEIFDIPVSLFTRQYTCWTEELDKSPLEDDQQYGDRINERFHKVMENVDIEGQKVLRFLVGLKRKEDAEHLPNLLAFADRMTGSANGKVTLQEVIRELKKLRTYKHDGRMISEKVVDVNAVHGRTKKRDENYDDKTRDVCWKCNKQGHFSKNCRFRGIVCYNCNKTGHIARNCNQSSGRYGSSADIRVVKTVERVARVNNFKVDSDSNSQIFTDIFINGVEMTFQVDTGSDVTLISRNNWKRLGRPRLRPAEMRLLAADNSEMPCDGRILCSFELHGQICQGDAYVMEDLNLVGMEWLNKSTVVNSVLDSFSYVKMEEPCGKGELANSKGEDGNRIVSVDNSCKAVIQCKTDGPQTNGNVMPRKRGNRWPRRQKSKTVVPEEVKPWTDDEEKMKAKDKLEWAMSMPEAGPELVEPDLKIEVVKKAPDGRIFSKGRKQKDFVVLTPKGIPFSDTKMMDSGVGTISRVENCCPKAKEKFCDRSEHDCFDEVDKLETLKKEPPEYVEVQGCFKDDVQADNEVTVPSHDVEYQVAVIVDDLFHDDKKSKIEHPAVSLPSTTTFESAVCTFDCFFDYPFHT